MSPIIDTSIILFLLQLFTVLIETNKICDSSQKLNVDSTLLSTTDQKLFLFSGEDFFELESIAWDKRPNITKIRQLNELSKDLIPPIEVSYEGKRVDYDVYRLFSGTDLKRWTFYLNWTLVNEATKEFTIFEIYTTDQYLVAMNSKDVKDGIVLIYSNPNDSADPSKYFTWKKRIFNGKSQIRRFSLQMKDVNNTDTEFFNDLNGERITSAFSLKTDFNKEILHLFASRYVCRMEISETDWLPFCKIKDISEWVDCENFNDKPRPDHTLEVTIILSVVVITAIIAICVFVFLVTRSARLKRSEPQQFTSTSRSTLSSLNTQ